MPHNEGLKATVVRLDHVVLEKNLFGRHDAFIFEGQSDRPVETFNDVRIGIENDWIALMLQVAPGSNAPDADDTVLMCERSGNTLYWYKIKYEYAVKTDE